MAYIGIDGTARKVINVYIGVNGTARRVTKGYVGDAGGTARIWWTGGDVDKYPVFYEAQLWYGGYEVDTDNIHTINIVDTYTPTGTVDESWIGGEGISCYIEGDTLTIAGNGSGMISLNVNSDAMFKDFRNVQTINGLELLDTSDAVFMKRMFYGCKNLLATSLNIANWDVRKVTTMESMFEGCSSLNTVHITNWSINSISNLNRMFANCTDLRTVYAGSGWTYNVNTVSDDDMFLNCSYCSSVTT